MSDYHVSSYHVAPTKNKSSKKWPNISYYFTSSDPHHDISWRGRGEDNSHKIEQASPDRWGNIMFLLLEPNLKHIPMPCRHWMWFRKKRIRNEEPSPSSTQAWRLTGNPDDLGAPQRPPIDSSPGHLRRNRPRKCPRKAICFQAPKFLDPAPPQATLKTEAETK